MKKKYLEYDAVIKQIEFLMEHSNPMNVKRRIKEGIEELPKYEFETPSDNKKIATIKHIIE